MLFRELFNKEFLTEEKIRKSLKIFYEIKIDLLKKEDVQNEPETPVQNEPVQNEPVQNEPAQEPNSADVSLPSNEQPQEPNIQDVALPSVVTEDDDDAVVNDENRIVRKLEGEVELTDTQKDNIQTLDDIIITLEETKKDGVPILDEFSSEIIRLLYSPNANEIDTKVDKDKSTIFVEFYYGYKKDDSVGVRFNKRKGNLLTSTMLIDNEIISVKFSIDMVNNKISEFRNYEANK